MTAESPGARFAPAAPPTRLRLRYAHVTVEVTTGEAADAIWLAEFLGPPFAVDLEARPSWRVTLDTDAHRFGELLARGPDPQGATVDTFVRDTGILAHPAWRSSLDEHIVFDRELGAFYCVARCRPEVTVVSHPHRARARVALMRAVREIATTSVAGGHRLLLHAAAFALGEWGVLVCGPKRAGKTTVLLRALSAGGAEFIANDRVVVELGAAHAPTLVRGMPTIVSVRSGTLAASPALHLRLEGIGYRHDLTIAESRSRRVPVRPAGASISLSPAQLCELLAAPLRPDATLGAILFPRLRLDADTVRIDRLDPGTASQRIVESLFHAAAPTRRSALFARPDDSARDDEASLWQRCAELAGRVPCFAGDVGTPASDGPAGDGLVQALHALAVDGSRYR